MTAELRRTPLYDEHVAAGGRLVPFAGWEMPVQYEGVAAEHAAVRERAGMFDVSHMGQIGTRGPDAASFLQHVVSNDVDKLVAGGAQYSCLCADDGGIVDDLFSYELEDWIVDYLTVSNAANHETDLARFRELAVGFDVEVVDLAADLRDARRPGARGPGRGRRPRLGRAAAADADRDARGRRRRGARLRHRLHGRGRRRDHGRAGRRRRRSGARCSPPA